MRIPIFAKSDFELKGKGFSLRKTESDQTDELEFCQEDKEMILKTSIKKTIREKMILLNIFFGEGK